MNCLSKCCSSSSVDKSQSYHSTVVHEGSLINLLIPERPLAKGSIQLIARATPSPFSSWTSDHHSESYDLIQKIVEMWKRKGVNDYIIYGKKMNDSNFSWEIIPYRTGSFWERFKVLFQLAFGATRLSVATRTEIVRNFNEHKNLFGSSEIVEQQDEMKVSVQKDWLCDPKVIEKQRVLEGKSFNVLYNCSPLGVGKGKLDFLVALKDHREGFSSLTKNEYMELMSLESKLIDFYGSQGYKTAFLFHQTGNKTGNRTRHFYENIIFTSTKTEELVGKITVFVRMLFGRSRLSEAKVTEQVASLKAVLSNVLA